MAIFAWRATWARASDVMGYLRKIVSALWVFLLVVMFLLLLAFGLTQFPPVQRWAGRAIADAITSSTGLPASVGSLRFFPFSSVEVSRVSIAGPDSLPMISLRRVKADISAATLVSGGLSLNVIDVDSLDVAVRQGADGRLNIMALAGPDSVASGSGAPSVRVRALRAAECHVAYEGLGREPLHLQDVSIALDDILFDVGRGGVSVSGVSFFLPSLSLRAAMSGRLAVRGDTLSLHDASVSLGSGVLRVDSAVVVADSAGVRHARVEIPSVRVGAATLSALADRRLPDVGMSLSARLDGGVVDVRRLRLSFADASFVTLSGLGQLDRAAGGVGLSWTKLAVEGRTCLADVADLADAGGDSPARADFRTVAVGGSVLIDYSGGEASANVRLSSEPISTEVYATAHSDDGWRTASFSSSLSADADLSRLTRGVVARVAGSLSAQGRVSGTDLRYAMLRGDVTRADVAGVTFTGLSFNGVADSKKANGLVEVNDPRHGHLTVVGEMDGANVAPYASLAVLADSVRLGALCPSAFTPNAWTSFRMRAETTGLDPRSSVSDVHLADFALCNRADTLVVNNLLASLDTDVLGRRVLSLQSDALSGYAVGNFDVRGLADELARQYAAAMPLLARPTAKARNGQKAEFELYLYQARRLASMFWPSVSVSDTLEARGSVDSRTHTAWMRMAVGSVSAASGSASGLEAAVASSDGVVGVGVRAEAVSAPLVGDIKNFRVAAEAEADGLTADVAWLLADGERQGGALNVDARFVRDNAAGGVKALIGVDQSQLTVGGDVWTLDSCRFDASAGRLGVSHFLLSNADHSIRAQGGVSASPDDTLRLALSKIVLEKILKTDATSKFSLEGDLYADAEMSAILGDARMTAMASIDRLKVNGDMLEHMDLTTAWSPEADKLDIGLDIVTGGVPRAVATGFIDTRGSAMDLRFDIDSLSTGFLNFYLDNCIDSWRGTTSGWLRLHGPLDDIALDSRLKMNDDNYFRVMQTNVTYHIDMQDSLVLSPHSMDFLNIRFADGRGKHGVFGGSIAHNMFSDLQLGLVFDVDDLLLLQTTPSQSPSYYGTVYGSGRMRISGPTKAVRIDIDARTERNSKFMVAPSAKSDVGSHDYILFKKPNEVVMTQTEQIGAGVSAGLNLQITPDAEMSVVINQQTGNKLTGRGSGQIQVNVDRGGELTMFGDYEIESGMYNFSFENIINKQFAINKGGHITWDGGPYDAMVDIVATYKLKASLYDLVQGSGEEANADLKRRVPVNCNILLSNKLTNPDIKFDIEIPSSQNFNQYAFDQYVNTQEEMNRQVFSLLMANKFYAVQEQGGQGNQGSSYLGTTASELLSNQLSSLFSQNDHNIGVGVNYRPGDEVTNEEYEVALSTQVLDNKILLSGNIGYGRDASGSSSSDDGSLIGDFDVEVKLNRQGNIRAKAYTHSNNDVIYETSPTTQGVGVSFQEDFNSFRELFQKYWRKIFRRRYARKAAAQETAGE